MYQAPVRIEDVMACFKELQESGKIKHVGLSEAPPEFIRRAHAVTPISAVQQEWSLIARDLEAPGGVVDTCRELGIGFVAYSPLSRGLLSGEITSLDQLGENDRRRDMPRFQGDNLANNLAMVKAIGEIAADKGVSTAAIAIAWVLSRGDDVVPIPGCSRRSTLQNSLTALEVELTAADTGAIEAALDADRIIGTRYPEPQMARLGI